MRHAVSVAFVLFVTLCVALGAVQERTQAKLRVGDIVSVKVRNAEGYDGEYQVVNDGSITGIGFGRIRAEGKTVEQLKSEIVTKLKAIFRAPVVDLLLLKQRVDFVYVSGVLQEKAGPVELTDGMDLRSLVTLVAVPSNQEELEAVLFRRGAEHLRMDIADVLSGANRLAATLLEPNDVVTINKIARLRVWVIGDVMMPGEKFIRGNSDVHQAIAAAGGYSLLAASNQDAFIRIRRGTEVIDRPLRSEDATPFIIEAGDTIEVVLPQPIRITVGGEVKLPDEYSLRKGASVEQAIQEAGGVTPDGTLTDVFVIRGGETWSLDVSAVMSDGPERPNFALQDGDQVYVRRNENLITVLGSVTQATQVKMQDNRKYDLAEAVALAGGPTDSGSVRHVFLARKGENGKIEVTEYHLDEFLKDGNIKMNPSLIAGDIVFVGKPRGVTAGGIAQAISTLVMLGNFITR